MPNALTNNWNVYKRKQLHRSSSFHPLLLQTSSDNNIMKKFTTSFFIVASVLVSCFLGACHGHGSSLKKNFYKKSCPQAEAIIQARIQKHVHDDPGLPADLIRMHFHDCFVRGCDGSVLLNSTSTNSAEKDAIPNLTLAGFDIIDDLKSAVEEKCPGIVSCADIVALAARDSVSVQFNKPLWEVLTGRRDGTISKKSDVLSNIPAPSFNFSQLKQNFANKGLSVHDLVVLSGAHTIGNAHCNAFSTRLYNFDGKGGQDPSLDPTYAKFLKTKCKSLSDNTTVVDMDPGSAEDFDSDYYKIVIKHKGLFQSDAALLTTKESKKIVFGLVNQQVFFSEFAQSMKKMGAIGVLTGSSGEIRNKCYAVNSN